MDKQHSIIITGASRGIGRAIALRFAAQTDISLHLVSRDMTELSQVASECEDISSKNVNIHQVDLADPIAVQELCDFITRMPTLQCLINNAGTGSFGPTAAFSLEEWNRIISTNLTAVFRLSQAALLPMMRTNNSRTILNISSDADRDGFNGAAAYCASKAGLAGLSRALQVELQPHGIRVGVLSPGRVDTFFNDKQPGMRPRALSSEDVAEVAHFMCTCSSNIDIHLLRLESMTR